MPNIYLRMDGRQRTMAPESRVRQHPATEPIVRSRVPDVRVPMP